jgi:hypothetical protein
MVWIFEQIRQFTGRSLKAARECEANQQEFEKASLECLNHWGGAED